jgi:hypothetical protein
MRERVVKIGRPKPLFGIFCEPDELVSDRVAVILLNSGVMHRVGSCRLSVKLSRAVCERAGLMSLRFDFSGIGDSEPRRVGGPDFGDREVAEVREVMDYLQETKGVDSFILYGLCSGAFISCQVGLVDDRVIGMAQIDSYCYPTIKSHILYYLPRVISVDRWANKVRRLFMPSKLRGQEGMSYGADDPNFEVPVFAEFPDRAVVAGWFAEIAKKNISLYGIYTGREPSYFYLNQFKDIFPEADFGDRLSLDYMPGASHIISQAAYQKDVVDGVVGWASRVISTR